MARARSKCIRFRAHLLEHGDEEVAQRCVGIALEGKVLAVFEAAAGEEDGEVGVIVRVRICLLYTSPSPRD